MLLGKYVSCKCKIGRSSRVAFHVKGETETVGQKESTCANGAAYVPPCVSVNSSASDSQTQSDYKNVRKRNRTELSSSATETEKERDLENKKTGRRQRCSSVPSVQVWV